MLSQLDSHKVKLCFPLGHFAKMNAQLTTSYPQADDACNTHLVVWQQQVVEAGVGSGQPVTVRPRPADGERGGQTGQALDGHPVTACHKEQQLFLLLLRQTMDHFPEPFHHLQTHPISFHGRSCPCEHLPIMP